MLFNSFLKILLAYSSIDSYSTEGLHIYIEEQIVSELNILFKVLSITTGP